jgi:hypothetical protein
MQRGVSERIQGPDDPVGTTHNNLATLYRAQAVTATPNRAASSKSMQIRCQNTR